MASKSKLSTLTYNQWEAVIAMDKNARQNVKGILTGELVDIIYSASLIIDSAYYEYQKEVSRLRVMFDELCARCPIIDDFVCEQNAQDAGLTHKDKEYWLCAIDIAHCYINGEVY